MTERYWHFGVLASSLVLFLPPPPHRPAGEYSFVPDYADLGNNEAAVMRMRTWISARAFVLFYFSSLSPPAGCFPEDGVAEGRCLRMHCKCSFFSGASALGTWDEKWQAKVKFFSSPPRERLCRDRRGEKKWKKRMCCVILRWISAMMQWEFCI